MNLDRLRQKIQQGNLSTNSLQDFDFTDFDFTMDMNVEKNSGDRSFFCWFSCTSCTAQACSQGCSANACPISCANGASIL